MWQCRLPLGQFTSIPVSISYSYSSLSHTVFFTFQLTLLFPVYDKLHRLAGDHWRLFAATLSAIGTAFTVAVLTRSLEVATVMDELAMPVLAVFTTAIEVVGFAFIYGEKDTI